MIMQGARGKIAWEIPWFAKGPWHAKSEFSGGNGMKTVSSQLETLALAYHSCAEKDGMKIMVFQGTII